MKNFGQRMIPVISVLLVLALVVSPFLSMADLLPDGHKLNDVAQKLDNVNWRLSQDGVVITGETLNKNKGFTIELDFDIPVKGDIGRNPKVTTDDGIIQKGEMARIKLVEGLKLKVAKKLKIVADDGENHKKDLASVEVKEEGMDTVLDITFDGDDTLFNGASYGVSAKLKAEFNLDDFADFDVQIGKTIVIFNKTFTLANSTDDSSSQNQEMSIKKSGNLEPKSRVITWTVLVQNKGGSLKDFVFSDTFPAEVDYVAGTFKVGGAVQTDPIGNSISYTFPSSAGESAEIEFKTKIKDDKFFAIRWTGSDKSKAITVKNTAKLANPAGSEEKTAVASVNHPEVQWIKKSYGEAPRGRIKWIVTINEGAYDLKTVKVFDDLPKGLTHVSSIIKKGDGDSGSTIAPTISGSRLTYDVGDISTKAVIEITTAITGFDPSIHYAFRNVGRVLWPGSGEFVSVRDKEVKGVYQDPSLSEPVDLKLEKTGDKNSIDENGTLLWNIKVKKDTLKYTTNPKVYDLIVFDKAIESGGLDQEVIDFLNGKGLTLPSGVTVEQIAPKYLERQKLVSTKSEIIVEPADLTVEIHKILMGTKHVADLVEVSGANKSVDWNIKLRTLPLKDRGIFLPAKDRAWVHNTANLVSGGKAVDRNTASAEYLSRIFTKEMLKAEAVKDFKDAPTAILANQWTKNHREGFSHKTNSVIFRFSLNSLGHKYLHDAMGNLTITDTLPDGWEFVKIKDDKNFLAFKGRKLTEDGQVEAVGEPLETADLSMISESANFAGEREATLNVTGNLPGPVVIFVEARPKTDTLKAALEQNSDSSKPTYQVTNTANIKRAAGNNFNVTQDVSFSGEILTKNGKQLGKTKSIKWTIDYVPYADVVNGDVVSIVDVLEKGMELRLDGDKPKIEGENYKLYEATLNDKGELVIGAEVSLVADVNLKYEKNPIIPPASAPVPDKKRMTIKLPNKNKCYRFEYITDVVGTGGLLTNTVSIESSKINIVPKVKKFDIALLDGSGTYKGVVETPQKPHKPKPPTPTPPPEKPPVTPPAPPSEPPVTPPTPPNNPPAVPPETPKYPPSNPPDPNDPNSPPEIEIIGDDGVPLGKYKKVPKPGGGFEYIDEEGIPLGNMKLVGTGNDFPEMGLIAVAGMSILGIALVLEGRRRRMQ